jgi:hypothetical protein
VISAAFRAPPGYDEPYCRTNIDISLSKHVCHFYITKRRGGGALFRAFRYYLVANGVTATTQTHRSDALFKHNPLSIYKKSCLIRLHSKKPPDCRESCTVFAPFHRARRHLLIPPMSIMQGVPLSASALCIHTTRALQIESLCSHYVCVSSRVLSPSPLDNASYLLYPVVQSYYRYCSIMFARLKFGYLFVVCLMVECSLNKI